MNMPGHDIIVIGASAGGVEALTRLVRELPPNLPATLFVVLHIPSQSPSLLPQILDRAGPLEAIQAEEGAPITHGRIYVARPDHHLLIARGRVRVVRGPRENRHRPAIDPLFRSAAYAYGPRVVGVVLTGSLDDGTAGLAAIKSRGGIAVVQDPREALYSGMPRSAIEHVAVDHCLSLAGIAPLLARLAAQPVEDARSDLAPRDMKLETKIVEMDQEALQNQERPGKPSAFSCPECNGVLWEIDEGELIRFRCRVGHAFSVESMLAGQNEALEDALWAALNTLEESAMLTHRMIRQARERNQRRLTARLEERVRETEQRAASIRQVLLHSETADPSTMDDVEGYGEI